jgi:hypothetical protein
MVTELEELHKRVDKIEKQKNQEILTLVEILSNATFFGEIKKANCEYAKNGQCSFFILKSEAKNKMPIATECRIKQCKEPSLHCHIELSNISCTLCQITNNGPEIRSSEHTSKKSKDIIKTQENLIPRLSKKNS